VLGVRGWGFWIGDFGFSILQFRVSNFKFRLAMDDFQFSNLRRRFSNFAFRVSSFVSGNPSIHFSIDLSAD
jgi:hypothetical protein